MTKDEHQQLLAARAEEIAREMIEDEHWTSKIKDVISESFAGLLKDLPSAVDESFGDLFGRRARNSYSSTEGVIHRHLEEIRRDRLKNGD